MIELRNKSTGAVITKTLKNWKHLPAADKAKYEPLEEGNINVIPAEVINGLNTIPGTNLQAPPNGMQPLHEKLAQHYAQLTGSFSERCNELKTVYGLHYNTIKKHLKDAGITE